MKKLKATNIYNPRYAEGDILLQNLRSNVLRNSASIAEPYAEGTVRAIDDDFDTLTNVHPDWTQPQIGDDGRIASPEDVENDSWISQAFSGISNILLGDGSFYDRLSNASPADAWRMFHEKRLQAELTSAQTKMEEVSSLLQDLKDAEDYVNLLKETNELRNRYDQELAMGTKQEDLVPYLEKMQDNINKMKDFMDRVKTTGKKSDVLVDMFYDTDKLWDSKKAMLGAVRQNLWVDPNTQGAWYNPATGLEEFGSLVGNVLMSGANAIGKLLPDQVEKSGSFTRRAIKQSLPDDDSFVDLIRDYQDNPYMLQQRINNHREYYQRLLKEREADVKDVSRRFKEGDWYFDPSKISPEYRKLLEMNGNSGLVGAFVDPSRWLYGLPEMGTSYSDWKDFMGLMASDVALKKGSQLATKYLSKKANPWVQLALGIGTVASQIGWTASMRDMETSSEAMDGQSSRVINNTMRNGGDLAKALDSITTMMNARGYDASQFTDIEKVLMALAYNFKTGDEVFDNEVEESRKGLSKLINHNNALAMKDYLQALPYMDYTRSFLRSVGSMMGRSKSLREYGTKENLARYRSNTAGDISARAVLDRHIDKVASKHIKDLGRRMMIARAGKWAGGNIMKMGGTAALEGIEEGQQYITQQRYERGLYDDYTAALSMFDIPSILEDAGLGAEAILAYWGLLPGDPNNGDAELVRAMNIGAATGGMFHATSALLNFLPSTGKDNVRNLIAQFKNDKIINHIVGENYGKMEDDEHIGMYFDALSKYGVNRTRLQNSLQQLKSVLGENTSSEYVDRDVDLMNATVSTYENTMLDDMLTRMHIDRGTDKHKQFVKNAVRNIIDFNNANDLSNQKWVLLNSIISTLVDLQQAGSTETEEYNFGVDELKKAQEYVTSQLEAAKKDREVEEQRWKDLNRPKFERELRESLGEEADNIDQDRITQEVERRVNEAFLKVRDAKDSNMLQPIDDESSFIWDQYSQILGPEYLKQLQIVYDMLTGQREDLIKLGEETGTDIQLDRLTGMINSIKRKLDEEKDNVNKLKQYPEFEQLSKIAFKNQKEISDAIRAVILNDAIADALQGAYQVYTVGRVDPNSIQLTVKRPLYKDLSEEEKKRQASRIRRQHASEFENASAIPDNVIEGIYNAELALEKNKNPFGDLIRKHDKEVRRIKSIPQGEKTVGDYDNLHEIERETALRYAINEFDDVQQRQRIAHREWNADRPLTSLDISNAQAGDKEAQAKVDNEISEEAKNVLRQGISEEDWDNNAGLGQQLVGLELIGVTGQPTSVVAPTPAPTPRPQSGPEQPVSLSSLGVTTSPEEPAPAPAQPSGPISLSSLGVTAQPEGELEQPSSRTTPPGPAPITPETPEPAPSLDPDTGEPMQPPVVELQPDGETPKVKVEEGPLYIEPEPGESEALQIDWDREIQDETLMDLQENGMGTLQLFSVDDDDTSAEDKEANVQHSNLKKDYIGQTFFYDHKATTPSFIKVNGVDVNFGKNKKVRTGKELAEKLEQKGWFAGVKKYYIVTGDQTNPKAYGYTGYNPDTYTVALILEDGDDIYATFMRNIKPYVNNVNSKTAGSEPRKLGLSSEEIFRQENILARNRMEIIDAFCPKDKNGHYIIPHGDGSVVNKTVVPVNPRISNGSIQNERKDGQPVFRTVIGEDAGFGLSDNMEELTRQLLGTDERPIVLGMGRGQFATAEEKYKIVPLFLNEKNKELRLNGTGYAGKLYMSAVGPSGKSVPVLLSEMKFWDHIMGDGTVRRILNEEDVELVIDPVTGIIPEGKLPSIGELLYYLITNRLNERHLPYGMRDLQQTIARLMVNFGEDTLLSDQDKARGLTYYVKKQLAFDGLMFYVGDPNELLKTFNRTPLQLRDNPQELRHVAYLISRNFHWNTDKTYMQQMFLDDNPDFKFSSLIEALKRYFETHPKETSISIAGMPLLTFDRDDFFTKDGRELEAKPVSVAAWMLKTGKLSTDLSKNMFTAPFVFATGVKRQSQAAAAITQVKERTQQITGKPAEKKGVIDLLDAAAADETLTQTMKSRIDAVEERMSKWPHKSTPTRTHLERAKAIQDALNITRKLLTSSKEEKAKVLDKLNKDLNRESNPYKEIFLIDTSEFTKDTDKKVAEKNIRTKVKEALKRVNIQADDATLDDKLKSYTAASPLDKLNQIIEGSALAQLRIWEEGGQTKWRLASINADTSLDIQQMYPVTGVFSTHKNKGRLNKKDAIEWLQSTLGINPNRVYVTNGILRGCNNEIVFGAMDACLDELGRAVANVSLSTARGAGRGVHFHEAWHYVNLLLHSEAEREALYRLYLEKHPELNKPETKYSDIEEKMAEEFRRYAEMRKGLGIANKIRRLYNDVLDFINAGRKKDMLRIVFDSIMAGEYKAVPIGNKEYYEFKRRFPDGVNKAEFSVDGVSQRRLDKLEGITSYTQFYEVGEALAHMMLDKFGFLRSGDVNKKVTASKYKAFIQDLIELQEDASEQQKLVIQDVLDNMGVFNNIIREIFGKYGIEIGFRKNKTSKLTREEMDEDPSVREELQEATVWDIDQLKISKKDNVAYKAKLFLSLIPKTKYQYDEVGNRVEIQDSYSILNTPKYVSFDEAWHKIVDNLHDVRYFNKTSEEGYDKASILGRVLTAAQTDPFFSALLKKLERIDEDDVELQNLIFGTIASQKSKVAYYEIKDPVVQKWMSDELSDLEDSYSEETYDNNSGEDEIVADRMRDWILQHDTTIRARRNLPRKWSSVLASSGLTISQHGVNVVSQNFAVTVNNQYLALKSLMITDPEAGSYAQRNNNIIREFVKLANMMAIPIDAEVVEQYLRNKANHYLSQEEKYKLLKTSFDTTQEGSIGYFVSYINQHVGSQQFKVGNYAKTLDRMYVGYEHLNKALPQISELAAAYQQVHPSSSEFSMTAPDGSRIYPISQNNNISDLVVRLYNNEDDILNRMLKSPYAKGSRILTKLKDLHRTGQITNDDKLEMNAIVGLKDGNNRRGKDYFGITPMEDYLIKMNLIFRDMMVLPTMADKKTYYTLQQARIKMTHDLLTYNDVLDSNNQVLHRGLRFSDDTLNIFGKYFTSELDALIQYYNKDNIKAVVEDQTLLRENYHGNIKDGRMDFSGNGGKFRYMYDVLPRQVGDQSLNFNQYLEFLYERQKIEEANGSAAKYGNDRDGFEAIREFLNELSEGWNNDRDTYLDGINNHLISMVYAEMDKVSEEGPLKILEKVTNMGDTFYSSRAIPIGLLNAYQLEFAKRGIKNLMGNAYMLGPYVNPDFKDITLSVMANHTIGTIMSIIEFEKVFAGDPAFYKWKNQKQSTLITFTGEDGNPYTVTVHNLSDAHSDKIKRLGANLSPGQNLRLDYTDAAAEKYGDSNLKDRKYTNLNISDINVSSKHLPHIRHMFTKQAYIDYYLTHTEKPDWEFVNSLYKSEKQFSLAWDSLKKNAPDIVKTINSNVASQMNPYDILDPNEDDGITVSDAQVIIRPALYRKIRISLGQWTDDDEIAYNILEKDNSWMDDAELSAKVHKLQLYPLKMSYFLNEPYHISDNDPINLPIYNKMAIFPLFKFTAASASGQQLYDRMNRAGDELDMISFASAVKVGLTKKRYSPYEKNASDLNEISEDINKSSKELGVQIQDLGDIRMQLNTEAHAEFGRSIGTQMFKLAFSNTYDSLEYGANKPWMKPRKGSVIKNDIMRCVKALTKIGAQNIMSRFYDLNEETGSYYSTPNRKKVSDLMQDIITSNGVGMQAADIIKNHGTVSSLMSRMLFEQAVSSVVNREVVNVNTKGGSAIQQSIFGFTGYNNQDVDEYDENRFHNYNNGRELNWNMSDGSMEVLLSMNFFKAVVPQSFQSQGYTTMRQWLINHDVIEGVKKSIPTFTFNGAEDDDINPEWEEKTVISVPRPFGVGYRIPTQGMSSIFTFTVADVLPEQSADVVIVPREFTAQTGSDKR